MKIIIFTWIPILSMAVSLPFGTAYSQSLEDCYNWYSFAKSANNPVVRDTFLVQTFENSARDNWKYSSSSDLKTIDARSLDPVFDKQGGNVSLRLFNNQTVTLDYDNSRLRYLDFTVHLRFAAYEAGRCSLKVAPLDADNMAIGTYYCPVDSKTGFYGIDVPVTRNPFYGVRLYAYKMSESGTNASFLIDSVLLSAKTYLFSCFCLPGSWNDQSKWTDYVPSNRHALIMKDISVDSTAACKNLYIGPGSVTIAKNAKLKAENLRIFSNDTANLGSLHSSGELNLSGKVSISRSFDHKGSWYFISFPFDVYLDGLPSNLTFQDDTFKGSGNYFYLKGYNGEKRARTGKCEGNWEVISANNLQLDVPILKAGHGYLIALDEGATEQMLTFSSHDSAVGTHFGREGRISIPFASASSASEENKGWFLCGNPLPAPLPLNKISHNEGLGDSIYVFDGSSYKTFPLSSDSVIPPYTAFFIKTKEATELVVDVSGSDLSRKSMFIPSELRRDKEPVIVATSNQNTFVEPALRISGRQLTIRTSEHASLRVLALSGRTVFARDIPAGESNLMLSVHPGFYVVMLDSSSNHLRQKFVIP